MLRRLFFTSEEDYKKKLESLKQTVDGKEDLDCTPMDPPLGFIKQPSMVEHIRALIKSEELRKLAEEAGEETFEEADDFDVDDDYDPISPWEMERYFEPHAPLSNPPADEPPEVEKPKPPERPVAAPRGVPRQSQAGTRSNKPRSVAESDHDGADDDR